MTLLWAALALINTAMPAVISVNPVNISMPVLTRVSRMPGNIVNIGVDPLDPALFDDYSAELISTLSTVPFFFDHLNLSTKLPKGYQDTLLFSTPIDPLSNDVTVMDPYASLLSVQCSIIPLATRGVKTWSEPTWDYQRAG